MRLFEAFDVGVFPRGAGRNEGGLEPALFDPMTDQLGRELRTVVGADKLRHAILLHRLVQHVDDVAGPESAIDFQGEVFLDELIDQRQPLQATSVAGLVETEVVAPNMAAMGDFESTCPVLTTAQTAALARPLLVETCNPACFQSRCTRLKFTLQPSRRSLSATMR
jgi:hypothetical protein